MTPYLRISAAIAGSITLALMAYVATRVGFISPDSWSYLLLADSLLQQGSCSIGQQYVAYHPCGYPALIALTSWLGHVEPHLAAKLLNAALLAGGGWFVYRASGNPLFGFLFAINPITLAIGHYTWSETTFLLSSAMVFYGLVRLSRPLNRALYHGVLIAGLLLGISTRYYFAPYAFLIFLCAARVYGLPLCKRVFPWFVLTALLFFAYLAYNVSVTGHLTGMQRIPAPESFRFLSLSFLDYLVRGSARYLLAALPVILLLAYSALRNRGQRAGANTDTANPAYRLMTLLGLSYLLLAFILRAVTHYDIYDERTVGFGLSFVLSAQIARQFRAFSPAAAGFIALAAVAAVSLLLSHRTLYTDIVHQRGDAYLEQNLTEALAAYPDTGPLQAGDSVVYFNLPGPKWSVAANPAYFYAEGVNATYIKTAPYATRETRTRLKNRLADYQGRCFFDFRHVKNRQELEYILSQRFAIDALPGIFGGQEAGESEPVYDPGVAQRIGEIFMPQALVPCKAF